MLSSSVQLSQAYLARYPCPHSLHSIPVTFSLNLRESDGTVPHCVQLHQVYCDLNICYIESGQLYMCNITNFNFSVEFDGRKLIDHPAYGGQNNFRSDLLTIYICSTMLCRLAYTEQAVSFHSTMKNIPHCSSPYTSINLKKTRQQVWQYCLSNISGYNL